MAQFETVGHTINASDLASDATYTDYPYSVTVTVDGMTVNDSPVVIPSGDKADLFYEKCESVAGGVRLYMKNNTFGTAKISAILTEKGV